MEPGVLSAMFNSYQKKILKTIAYQSIQNGLKNHKPLIPDLESLPTPLKEKGASFVTLTLKNMPEEKKLRGCIGSIFPEISLAKDVAINAYNSAFRDPRFSPLSEEELAYIDIKISVLSPFQKIKVNHFNDLLQQIQPYVDGIYLKSPDGKATFLPDVWSKLPDKEKFILELYRKAHLPIDYPFSKIEWYKYFTESF